MRYREVLIGLGMVGAGLLLFVLIPQQIGSLPSHSDEISPTLFPRLLAWLLILLGVVHVVQNRPQRTEAEPPSTAGDMPQGRLIVRAFGALAIAAAYVFLLPILGFTAASMVGLSGLILYLGHGRPRRAVLVAVPAALVLAELFSRGLNVPLPRSIWME